MGRGLVMCVIALLVAACSGGEARSALAACEAYAELDAIEGDATDSAAMAQARDAVARIAATIPEEYAADAERWRDAVEEMVPIMQQQDRGEGTPEDEAMLDELFEEIRIALGRLDRFQSSECVAADR